MDKNHNEEEKEFKTLKDGVEEMSDDYCRQADSEFHSLEHKIELYELALNFNPDNVAALNGLGCVYSNPKTGMIDLKKAALHFKRAIQIDSKYAPAHANLGAVCFYAGDHNEAIKHCKISIGIDPDQSFAYFMLSEAYEKLGKKELAKACENEGNRRRLQLARSANS